MRGILITFEGVEGSGKSTQAELLGEYLKQSGFDVILSREPGGTQIGEQIRNILLNPEYQQMDARTELFLYLACRNQHVREKILPALKMGKVVILDRFADSSAAYQGCGRELGEKFVSRLNKLVTAGLKPHLTILINVPVDVGYERKGTAILDRMEKEEVKFHERVRNGYLRMARRATGRIKVVPGNRSPEEVQSDIRALVDSFLSGKGRRKKCKKE